jgi:putative transposase
LYLSTERHQQSVKDLERAYQNFFAKRAGFPHFKKKGPRASFRYPGLLQLKLDHRIFLAKLGWVRRAASCSGCRSPR